MIERQGYESSLIYRQEMDFNDIKIEIDTAIQKYRKDAFENLLSQAAFSGRMDAIEYCLNQGASLDCFLDKHGSFVVSGNNPVYMAVRNGKIEIVKFFIEKINLSDYILGMYYWAQKSKMNNVLDLLQELGYNLAEFQKKLEDKGVFPSTTW